MTEKTTKQIPIVGVACRQSIGISDSLLDSSNPDLLVNYIRTKRNLERPRELFSNVFKSSKPRKSFALQLEPYNIEKEPIDEDHASTRSELEELETSGNEKSSEKNKPNNSVRLPRILLHKNELKTRPNAKKVLLHEFEMTIKSNEFLPPGCSTPIILDGETPQISSNNDINNKQNSKKSLIRQSVQPLTPGELKAAKLIECLQLEKMDTNNKNSSNMSLTLINDSKNVQNKSDSNLMKTNNQSENVTLNSAKVLENNGENVLSDQSTLKNQEVNNVNTSPQQQELLEEIENSKLNKSRCLIKSNKNMLVEMDIVDSQHSSTNNKSKNNEVLETEEFESPINSPTSYIPETQEPEINLNNETEEVPETEEFEIGINSENPEVPEINLNDEIEENSLLLQGTRKRGTFTIHKFNNTPTGDPVSIKKEYEIPPKSPRLSTSIQLSPLARRAQTKLCAKKYQNNLQSKIPKYTRTNVYFQKNKINSPLRNDQLAENINAEEMNLIENANHSLPMVKIPIYETVNTSENLSNKDSFSPLSPPPEFCNNSVEISPNQQKEISTELKSRRSRNEDSRLPNGIPSSPIYEYDRRSKLQNKSEINLNRNKTILENNRNNTIEAIDLRTTRRSTKRKSSIKANHRINYYYDNIITNNKNLEPDVEQIPNDLINIDVDLTNENNNIIRELLTPRFTPPPPIETNEDDDFQTADEYGIDNQQELEKDSSNSIRKNVTTRTSFHKKKKSKNQHKIDLDQNFNSKSTRNQQSFTHSILPAEDHSSHSNTAKVHINQTNSLPKNNETNKNISIMKSNKPNKKQSKKKNSSNKFISSNENVADPDQNRFQLLKDMTDVEIDKDINNKINTQINNIESYEKSYQSRQNLPSTSNVKIGETKVINNSDKYNRKKQKSRILSRHLTLSMLKKYNFNKSNELDEIEEQNIQQEETNSSKLINNRTRSQSSSSTRSEKSTIHIEDTFISNVNEELINDNPEAMSHFWRNSIANKSKFSEKTTKKNDRLKEFYLNIEKTLHADVSTVSRNRKLYTRGQSDIDTPNVKNNNQISSSETYTNFNNKSVIKSTTLKKKNNNDIHDGLNMIDDENPDITIEKVNENSIKANKKITKKNKNINRRKIFDENNKEHNIFKIPKLLPKSSGKKNQSKLNNMMDKKSVEPKPTEPENISDVQTDSTTQFGSPKRTSTKLANNIEIYSKKNKKNSEFEKLKTAVPIVRSTDINNMSAEMTDTIRRSRRRPCPRIQYWTNERNEFPDIVPGIYDPIKLPSKKFKKKSNIKRPKDTALLPQTDELPIITEENAKQPELPPNIDHQLSQIIDILKDSFSNEDKNSKPSSLENQSIDVVNNKSNKENKKRKNKGKKTIKNNENILEEPLPSTSKTIVVHSTNSDSGNATDINATKGIDPFSWLKNIINTSTSSNSSNNMIIERLTMGKNFQLSSFNCLPTVEKDGVEYYFCNTSVQNFGFIKLKPNLIKRSSKLKHFNINFILFCGELDFTVSDAKLRHIKAGEVVIIQKNINYSIANKSDVDALLLFIKIQ